MTQNDNIQPDTSQDTSNEQFNSLEEAVFGQGSSTNDISSAFTEGKQETTETAPEGQPAVGTQETTQEPQLSNDETRYQYWQSQADKYKNELDKVTKQQTAPAQPAPAETAQPAEPSIEEFPAPPNKPQRPRVFNREEAYSDPSSESARYLDELEGWRDDVSEYNSLKSQYQSAIIEEKFNKIEKSRVNETKRQQAAQQKSAQETEVRSHVMGHYGMSDSEAHDFMSKMSDPNSITIDNLVQLYRMQNNGDPKAPATPSPTFQQTRNAQQVPSPMGVMPSGQSSAETKTFEDKVMDNLIGDFNSKNPWK